MVYILELLVYVEDILACADTSELQLLKEAFFKRYKWITLDIGRKHYYLGMQTTIRQGCVDINM